MLNQKRNQFGGAISDYDIVRIDVTVLPDCLTKRTVLPVRVSGDDIKVLGKLFFYLCGQSKRIDISTKTDNLFLLVYGKFFLFLLDHFREIVHVSS